MSFRTAEDSKAEYVKVMGEPLGEQFAALWQQLAHLYVNWGEFLELYGTDKDRVDFLNGKAPRFFGLVQETLWETILLHLSRLTDPPLSGKGANLTVQNLPALVSDLELRSTLAAHVEAAIAATQFCRDWRNRRIAHHDLQLVLEDQPARPLTPASRLMVKDALGAIEGVLNVLQVHYCSSETAFEYAASGEGAAALLSVLGFSWRPVG